MKAIFRILCGLAFIGSSSISNAQMQTGSFEFDGRMRNYEVFLPQNYQAGLPAVLNLHGYGWTTADFAEYTLMHEFADTSDFILVYPAGSVSGQPGWNNGLRNHPFGRTDTTSDDVGFISALIDTLDAEYDIDLRRVYACGFSMGGEMTYRLAIELGQRFAAIASVAGKLNDISGNIGDPVRPFPLLHFHGTDDDVETYDGMNDGNLWPVEEVIDYWVEHNNCVLDPDSLALPDIDPNDGCTVERISFTNCSDSSYVIFYKIHNGGHSWPDAAWNYVDMDPTNRDINASSLILKFFKNYQNPLVDLAYGKSLEVYPKYMRPDGDTLRVNARLANPENHQVTVHAFIQARNSIFKDSVQLFDDGLHNDGLATDNIFGGVKSFAELDEDYFDIKLRTVDSVEATSTYCIYEGHFTTIGPVVCTADSLSLRSRPEDPYYPELHLTLKNEGLTTTAADIHAILTSMDTCIASISQSEANFGSIPAGESVTEYFYAEYNEHCALYDSVTFTLSIGSDGYEFWRDTIIIRNPLQVESVEILPMNFALHQNCPNPFNPSAILRYELPQASNVSLVVYDLAGKEIARLVDTYQEPGYHSVQWEARDMLGRGVPSGIYIARLMTPEYSKSIKMVLLK